MVEAGIDGGGLFKEFLTKSVQQMRCGMELIGSLSKEAFDTNRGLWLATNQNELYPNPHSYATECESCCNPERDRPPGDKRLAHQLSWYAFVSVLLSYSMPGKTLMYRSDEYLVKPYTMEF